MNIKFLSKEKNSKMKTFKEMLNEKAGLIVEALYGELSNKKEFDPNDPEIIVKGVGVYKLNQLKQNVHEKLADLVKKMEEGDYHFVDYALSPKGILAHFIKALLEVEKELNSPMVKRKISLMKSKNEENWSEVKYKRPVKEIAPPDKNIEAWVSKNKERYIKEYGPVIGTEKLYRRAWSHYKQKRKK
jgi:hypothetical protein